MSKDLIDFSVGTDAEFIMINPKTGRIVNSGDYAGLEDALGKDANCKTWEIRSKPSNDPLKVVESIRGIMQSAINNNPMYFDIRWVSGSYCKNLPLGIHIHFGLKKDDIKPEKAMPYLDNYVGAVSLLLENKNEGLLRRLYDKSPGGNPVSYGKMSDFRLKPHGFEYRPISSCIHSPHATAAILCLSKAVMFEVMNNPNFKALNIVEPNDFVTMNTAKIRDRFDDIWEKIQKLQLYPLYKEQIDTIHYLVKNNLSWNQGDDFKQNWGIVNLNKIVQPVEEFKVEQGFAQIVAAPKLAKNNEEILFEDIWGELLAN